MDMQILPWIKDDIAIEIIGKMIAEQVRQLNFILDAFEQIGLDEDSHEVQSNEDYQYHSGRIRTLYVEVQGIYKGEDKEAILEKADKRYAPYLKGRLQSHHALA